MANLEKQMAKVMSANSPEELRYAIAKRIYDQEGKVFDHGPNAWDETERAEHMVLCKIQEVMWPGDYELETPEELIK